MFTFGDICKYKTVQKSSIIDSLKPFISAASIFLPENIRMNGCKRESSNEYQDILFLKELLIFCELRRTGFVTDICSMPGISWMLQEIMGFYDGKGLEIKQTLCHT